MSVDIEEMDYPVLGEPVVIEFANTLYRHHDETIDFLDFPSTVGGWFAASPTASQIARPATFSGPMASRLRTLRNAVYEIIEATIDATAPGRSALATINEYASGSPLRLSLAWTATGPQRHEHRPASGFEALLGRLALDCIELVTGTDATALRRCDAPDCPMFYVKDHSRRRWCHNGCGHRDRQSRYYYRHRARAVPPAGALAQNGLPNA